eukprot:752396-Rhodomonas_salina.1
MGGDVGDVEGGLAGGGAGLPVLVLLVLRLQRQVPAPRRQTVLQQPLPCSPEPCQPLTAQYPPPAWLRVQRTGRGVARMVWATGNGAGEDGEQGKAERRRKGRARGDWHGPSRWVRERGGEGGRAVGGEQEEGEAVRRATGDLGVLALARHASDRQLHPLPLPAHALLPCPAHTPRSAA